MSASHIQVLLIEDNPGDARLFREMLNDSGSLKTELTHFECMKDALDHLSKSAVNIILLDLGLPDANGLGAVQQVHAVAPNIPLVVLTGLDDEALATQALQEGAQDYLIKGEIEPQAFLRALRYAIERQRMQVETAHVRKLQLQLKDEFLSHVSHELRSPLTAIYQFGTILADEVAGAINEEQRECLQVILRNVGQLQSMIGDLLEVTRAQEGKLTVDPQCMAVSDAIVFAVQTLQETARGKGVSLTLDLPPDLPPVHADPCFMLIQVTDSGCGISGDMTERIFERLYQVTDHSQAGRKGLGLGLYICKELVTRQGGQIWVTSSAQTGSVFSFTLPVFSMVRMIAPVLMNDRWPAESVALVTVEVRSLDGWFSRETREECSRDTRAMVQRCMLPNLDVLLPKMESGGPGEYFQVIAFADEKGVEVLTRRLHEQFQRLSHGRESRLTFSTSYKLLQRSTASPDSPVEDLADQTAAMIEDLIRSESLARTVLT